MSTLHMSTWDNEKWWYNSTPIASFNTFTWQRFTCQHFTCQHETTRCDDTTALQLLDVEFGWGIIHFWDLPAIYQATPLYCQRNIKLIVFGKSYFTHSCNFLKGSRDATACSEMLRSSKRCNSILIGQAVRQMGVAPPPNTTASFNTFTCQCFTWQHSTGCIHRSTQSMTTGYDNLTHYYIPQHVYSLHSLQFYSLLNICLMTEKSGRCFHLKICGLCLTWHWMAYFVLMCHWETTHSSVFVWCWSYSSRAEISTSVSGHSRKRKTKTTKTKLFDTENVTGEFNH